MIRWHVDAARAREAAKVLLTIVRAHRPDDDAPRSLAVPACQRACQERSQPIPGIRNVPQSVSTERYRMHVIGYGGLR